MCGGVANAEPKYPPDASGGSNKYTIFDCGHLVLPNEANFSPREAYLPMKLSCKFGAASWSSFLVRVLTLKISLCVAA